MSTCTQPNPPYLKFIHAFCCPPGRKKERMEKKTEVQDKMDIAKHDDQPHEL
jgi:hypothetical protein